MQKIVVGNHKGGVGKTFLTIVLGEYLSIVKGLRVLLIDLDPQGNLSKHFLDMRSDMGRGFGFAPPLHPDKDQYPDWKGVSSSADIWLGSEDDGVVPYPTNHRNLHILPAHGEDLQLIEMVKASDVSEKVIQQFAGFISQPDFDDAFDICLIDTRPSTGPLVKSAVYPANGLIIPTEFSEASIHGLSGIYSVQWEINKMRATENLNPIEIIGIVGNKLENVTIHKEIKGQLESDPRFADLMVSESFSNWIGYQRSMHQRLPSIFESKSKECDQATRICEELYQRIIARG